MRANTQRTSRGGMRQEGREWEGQNSGEQTETLGDLWKGEGWGGEYWVNKMDITGTFKRESREFEGGGLGWIIGGRKDRGFGWGMIRGGGEQLF